MTHCSRETPHRAPTGLPVALGVFCLFASGVWAPSGTPAAWAEDEASVTVGVERLYVRRGPGTEFPPFATLTKGDTVEVQEMQGEWARIVTGSGQTGYVRSTFLIAPGEREKVAPATPAAHPTNSPAAHAAATPVATPESAALRAAGERTRTLEAEVRTLQQQLAELQRKGESKATAAPSPVETLTAFTPTLAEPAAAPSTPAAGSSSGSLELVRGELARLTLAVDELQRRLDARPALEGPATSGEGAGWTIGSSTGRKSDRSRRPRMRF